MSEKMEYSGPIERSSLIVRQDAANSFGVDLGDNEAVKNKLEELQKGNYLRLIEELKKMKAEYDALVKIGK
jgi:hypothetical protein